MGSYIYSDTLPAGRDLIRYHVADAANGNVTYMLSHPKSGSTVITYFFELLTHRPNLAQWRPAKLDTIFLPYCYALKELKTDLYKKPIWKLHESNEIVKQLFYDPQKTIVVFLLRNYKEHVFREAPLINVRPFDQHGTLNENAVGQTLCRSAAAGSYFRNIEFFDRLPAENRLLIYYEDFIENPHKELTRLVEFFQDGYQELETVLADYTQYAQSFKQYYNKNWGRTDRGGGSISGGDDVRYHSKKHTYAQCKQIDEWVQKKYGHLWDTYLSRYDEDNFIKD